MLLIICRSFMFVPLLQTSILCCFCNGDVSIREIAHETISHRVERGEYANFTLPWVFSLTGYTVDRRKVQLELPPNSNFKRMCLHLLDLLGQQSSECLADPAAWLNVSVLSGSAGADELDKKELFPTLTRTVYKPSTMALLIKVLLMENVCFPYRYGYLFNRPETHKRQFRGLLK